ncbi:hypothetical protein RhiirA5_346715 [Rhizophagus irregularis]|uniref:Uncharacterized protein n=3 Tax=Rhizophagus irregularis TaxID=588596 RepID=A0A2I1FF42_9GLOM|nr:hypothetical protein RirG_112240 [Rhizophagus irregularis DAOM 197198w]PKC17103.1 hypothetical protein RhiirA5_346715 [Rhizophagus irregularis]GBC43855.1 hypothetical protein RIR_jg14954.t1 [Rhizophagus irregularis DAOM 181602=DAOM 197198]PKC54616.1 hypothetical protein RhiirA1_429846 [Rhizophagus irregularis]PKY32937.1 hypothetical protein RhiirB3_420336 [Rhizophagus irregularis]
MSSTQNGALNMPTNSNVMSRRNVNNRERQNQLMRRRIINKLQQKCSQLNNTPIDNQDMLDRMSNMPRQIVNNEMISQFFNGFSF